MKRFKVVQDASGDWGILDTLTLGFQPGTIDGFAGYGFPYGTVGKWIHLIREHAISLNAGKMDRDEFSWSAYEPREDGK